MEESKWLRVSISLIRFSLQKFATIYLYFEGISGVVKCGGYRYEDGTRYIGDWNHKGQKHGMGHLMLPGTVAIYCVN